MVRTVTRQKERDRLDRPRARVFSARGIPCLGRDGLDYSAYRYAVESTSSPASRKARSGCLIQVVGALMLGVIVALLVIAITAPWAFYMGGGFHIIPMWQGWGRLHSTASGGDYVLFVSFSPRNGTRGVPHVAGRGELCTPRGERYTLSVGGDFEKHLSPMARSTPDIPLPIPSIGRPCR